MQDEETQFLGETGFLASQRRRHLWKAASEHVAITHLNNDAKVLAFHRWANGGAGDSVMVVCNFANRTVTDYLIGFPQAGEWRLRFDSHNGRYDDTFSNQVSSHVVATATTI